MTSASPMDRPSTEIDRRGALKTGAMIGVAGVSAGALAACGSGDSGSSTPPPNGTTLAKTSDVPAGGGTVLADKHVVLTQPTAGTFKCFSSTCTHQGCTVKSVANNVITCPCHGSQYSATDGSVKHGPAAKPLPSVAITVKNGEISTT